MDMQRSSSTDKFIPMSSITHGVGKEIAADIFNYTVQIVNVCFVGTPGESNDWVLIDAGMPRSANMIISKAEDRFGAGARPKAIILTHAHFDHIGAIVDLVEKWNVPVYAHELELPYLTGKKNYPKPDGTVEGGLIAKISPFFPNEAIDLGSHVHALPPDGSIPEMPDWRWIHTPGHSEGHISLFRVADRALIAGDAFVTVKQEDLYDVLTQDLQMHGPPRYLTTDWQAAWKSVKQLAALKPTLAVTGHGLPVSGEWLTENLATLARDFDKIAIPDHGRYTD
ncbi:MBL fold metallo-hydrolase [Bacillus canaveralius]|uniref:MBL fold metallo-hydrolase n=1 Tax=Bacillus canaveralius TaxID=1403243 RepID=UPI000F793864|nr:MBL fold metallo-hydrolase [Bacillus canaveralius]RSK53940.1 MBL fold metallo-hydrolase [Bacillus canaveralius]